MSRVRLREAHTPEKLAELYAKPHDHSEWTDHLLRVDVTISVARWALGGLPSAADLSCGDGAVLRGLDAERRIFGDFAPGWDLTGPIELTIDDIAPVGAFVCCETLEHLDDPDAVLAKIRAKAKTLVLSTPVEAWDDKNEEHYWAWDRAAVEDMLGSVGFSPAVYVELDLRGVCQYAFGIWIAR